MVYYGAFVLSVKLSEFDRIALRTACSQTNVNICNPQEQTTTEIDGIALDFTETSSGHSQEHTTSPTQKTNESSRCKQEFSEVVKPAEANVRSLVPGVVKTAECPCTYGDIKSVLSALKKAQRMLEQLHVDLKQASELQEHAANLVNSVSRILHDVRFPM
ncbi:hypothetical protein CLF_104124 [Clonorchis sinensis]|uniref:Uncharacterized protein n=1 Tax=Clonorchis sinensis TaxID=79923 RepID=G7YB13_CLOSI|nr:hypothetical protein CLF_104124 [Clonorchis sinensis]